MSVSRRVPMISRQKLDSFRRTSQSHPGSHQPRQIRNITNEIAPPGVAIRTGSGSAAQSRGSGQRVKNRRASKSDAGFPRPVAA
ncbi:MAG: hypothetical protein V9E89_14360 [Ilumatobacteraceae bacterium]